VESILDFFGEYIRGINLTRYVMDSDLFVNDVFLNRDLSKVEVFHALANAVLAPFDTGLVVIIDGGGDVGVRKAEVTAFKAKFTCTLGAFVGGLDFGLCAAAATLLLPEGVPSNWAPHPHHQVARHGAEFPEGDLGSIRDRVVDLRSPIGIRVGS
jgi:hypothetical protein